MNCEELRSLLNEYVDDELSSESREGLEIHARSCAGCRAELHELRALLDSASRLERRVAPERDLWSGIEQRIAPPTAGAVRGPWWSASWLGWAAAAVLVAALAIQVTRQETTTRSLEHADSGTRVESLSRTALISDEARARDGLLQVRVDLLRSIAERRDSLDPEAREAVDETLRIIDQAITDLYDALQDDPDNQRLEFLLAATYQREVEFLKQVNLL